MCSVALICRSLRSGKWARTPACVSVGSLPYVPPLLARLLDPDAVQQALVAPPSSPDLDLEIEEHAGSEVALELLAGGRAHLADHAPALPHENRLLGVALHPDLRPDLDQTVVPRLDRVDHHLHRVWDLVAGAAKHLLADQLREMDVAREVRAVLGRIQQWTLGQQRDQVLDQGLESGAGPRAHRKDVAH